MESRRLRISKLLVLAVFAFPLLSGCSAVSKAEGVMSKAEGVVNAFVKLKQSRQKRNQTATSLDDRVRRAE